MNSSRAQALLIVGAAVLLSIPHAPAEAAANQPDDVVHIFFSSGCSACWPYVEEVLMPSLRAGGGEVKSEIHDYTLPEERERLLFTGRLPEEIDSDRLEKLLGFAKHRAYMNYWYGVVVEEAIQLAVEEEVHKEQCSRGRSGGQQVEEIAW
jgi:hypothetical protein